MAPSGSGRGNGSTYPPFNYRNNHHCNGHNNDNSHLLLCQWTPLSPAATTSSSEDPPKHIIRYTPDSNMSHLDLDLCLKGLNSELDSIGQSKKDQVKKASSGGFWTSD